MKTKPAPTHEPAHEPLLPDGHPYVKLPDGRIAKVCRTYPIGRQEYINIRFAGRHLRLSVKRLGAFLDGNSNPATDSHD